MTVSENISRTRLPARLDSLPGLLSPVRACAVGRGLSPQRVNDLELCLEEAVVNVFRYAYPDGPGEVEVVCRPGTREFTIEIVDQGIPFNPLSLPSPDLDADIQRRPVGGLGVFLIRTLVDEVRYRREGGRNILTLTVHHP